jgi:hypothetical protein
MKLVMIMVDFVRASALVLATLALGGCSLAIPEALTPDAQPGGDYYEGYMVGTAYGDSAWKHVGWAGVWNYRNAVTAADDGIQRGVLNPPPSLVEGRSAVWIEAFRAGALSRYKQYEQAADRRVTANWLIGLGIGLPAVIVLCIVASRSATGY